MRKNLEIQKMSVPLHRGHKVITNATQTSDIKLQLLRL